MIRPRVKTPRARDKKNNARKEESLLGTCYMLHFTLCTLHFTLYTLQKLSRPPRFAESSSAPRMEEVWPGETARLRDCITERPKLQTGAFTG